MFKKDYTYPLALIYIFEHVEIIIVFERVLCGNKIIMFKKIIALLWVFCKLLVAKK